MAHTPSAGLLAAAVLLPPLAVFRMRGAGRAFWIAVALTLFGWLPGVIFALLVTSGAGIVARL